MLLTGFMVAESDKAVGFVRESDVRDGVKPLWVPKAKIVASRELDVRSRTIQTAQGQKVGLPLELDVDESFLAKVGLA